MLGGLLAPGSERYSESNASVLAEVASCPSLSALSTCTIVCFAIHIPIAGVI